MAVGHVSEEQRHAYDLVLQAQLAAIDAVRPGVPCEDIDKAVSYTHLDVYKRQIMYPWPRMATPL